LRSWAGCVACTRSLAVAGTVALAFTSVLATVPGSQHRTMVNDPMLLSGETPVGAEPAPGQGVAELMGGSGVPIPPDNLVQTAFDNYAVPNGYGDYAPERLFTPEGLQYILGSLHGLLFDKSVAEGATIVESTITQEIDEGHPVLVGGVSQSATINATVLQAIADGSYQLPSTDQLPPGSTPLAFISLGDPSAPDGGVLERFNFAQDPHASIPSLGITFSGGDPTNTGIPDIIYNLEYDGLGDFPQYPINFVSDLNAVFGIDLVHNLYIRGLIGPDVGLTPAQIAQAVQLPVTPGYDGGTTFYEIPFTGQLPFAQVIQDFAGKPLADLLAPDLTVLANLGYGPDPDIGWSTTPANLQTPAELFYHLDGAQVHDILQALEVGTAQGIHNFMADLANPSAADIPAIFAGFADPAASATAGVATSLDGVADDLSNAVSTLSAMGTGIGDVINALVTVLPANLATLFFGYLQEGNVLDAFGMPVAANTGLDALGFGVIAAILLSNLPTVESDLGAVFDPSTFVDLLGTLF